MKPQKKPTYRWFFNVGYVGFFGLVFYVNPKT